MHTSFLMLSSRALRHLLCKTHFGGGVVASYGMKNTVFNLPLGNMPYLSKERKSAPQLPEATATPSDSSSVITLPGVEVG